MMKRVLLSVFMVLSLVVSGFTQVELARESFETSGGHGYNIYPDQECACCALANVSWYPRPASGSSGCYPITNLADGNFFWATENTEDINLEIPGNPYADEVIVELKKVAITGYESLEILFLAGHGLVGEVENSDYMKIQYAIDADIAADNYTTASQFFGFATSNRTLQYDANADGILDGDTLSRDFKEFTADLGNVTGDTLSVRFVFFTDRFGEDTSLDNIRVQGVLAPLAVEIIDFQVSEAVENDELDIHWTTANEINLSAFELQRSTDGRNWTTIHTEAPKGAGQYLYNDKQFPAYSTIYYRLRWIDFDGQIGFSSIRTFSPKSAFIVGIPFPNPLKKDQNLQVNIHSKGKQTAQWTLFNLVGQVQQVGNFVLENGDEVYELDLKKLPIGVYYWQLNIDDQQVSVSKRVVVVE